MEYLATVGMFDGVHRGHRDLLCQFVGTAESMGLQPLILTFAEHPLKSIRPDATPAILLDTDTKIELLQHYFSTVEVRILPADILKLSSAEFLNFLQKELGVRAFAMGFNNHIGHDRASVSDLCSAPIPVIGLNAKVDAGFSSSAIRKALSDGNVFEANRILGHPFAISGKVEHGQNLGHTIGFPTANLNPAPGLITPGSGVYAVDVLLPDNRKLRGMANIGTRPTIDNANQKSTIEINIFGFDGSLYGKEIRVFFLKRLRDEKKFSGLAELKAQLSRDRVEAESIS